MTPCDSLWRCFTLSLSATRCVCLPIHLCASQGVFVAHCSLGHCYLARGRLADAEAHYSTSIEMARRLIADFRSQARVLRPAYHLMQVG
jgi:hypothetical protein